MPRHVNCCVPGCESRGSQQNVTFHKFPDVDDWTVRHGPDGSVDKLRRRQIWEERLLSGRRASHPYRVCSLHFVPKDFIPSWEGRARKSKRLKKTAVPSCNLPPSKTKDGGSWKGLETELPDGSVCEFFTDKDEKADSTSASTRISDGDGIATLRPATSAVGKRGGTEDPFSQWDERNSSKESPSQKELPHRLNVDVFDFECVIDDMDNGIFRLPSSNWSYTLLNRSALIFLCWDKDLRLTKKAVLRRGSPLELFCDDRLLATNAELPVGNYDELKLALRYLDKYEWCQGVDDERASRDCKLYSLNGTIRCTPCHNMMTIHLVMNIEQS